MSHPAEMSGPDLERARAIRAAVHEKLDPEALDFIAGLVRAGLLRGWRDVTWAGTREEAAPRNAAIAARSITAGEFLSPHPITREGYPWIS